ncbi:MAG: CorA family divalent cation transporter [Polyangiales bacterium]
MKPVPAPLLTVHDRRGLVFGYELPTCTPVTLGSAPASAQPVWLHFNLTDARARAWLSEEAGLPEVALEVMLDSQTRARLQRLPTGVVAVLTDLQHGFRGDPEGFADLRVYVEPGRVITARRRPLETVDTLRLAFDAGSALPTPSHWLEQYVESLADNFARVVHELVDQVDELEDEIVLGGGLERRATLASIRRLLVRFRRHVSADRTALAPLRARDDRDQGPMRHALEHLDGIAQDIELVHERVRLLQEEVAALLAESTNRNLYVLSIVTTVLLPTTVVTGLWGMNVGGMPWQDDGHGFLWALLAVLASVVLSLALLRGSRVL